MITWQLHTFADLSNTQLYQLLKLRVDVFVVEQTCPYPELDNKDIIDGVYHLIGYQGDGLEQKIVACARLLPAGVSYPHVSIGRIATAANARSSGIGHKLLKQARQHCQQLWPNQPIEIGAQAHLEAFYQQHGFVANSEGYLEDDIPHIDMLSPSPLTGNVTLDI